MKNSVVDLKQRDYTRYVFRKLLSRKTVSIDIDPLPQLNADDGFDVVYKVYNISWWIGRG